MENIKLFIIDDHQIVRDGLKALFDKNSGIEVIGESNGNDNYELAFLSILPDVVLMDISLGEISGIELLKDFQLRFPTIKIIMLSMYNDEHIVYNAIEAGAMGYLPKTTSKDEIIKAIKEVFFNNKKYFNEQITEIMFNSIINQKKKAAIRDEKPGIDVLSNREIQLLKLFAEGLTNQEIADKLFLSIRTVESHKTHIMQKLELRTVVELVKFALKNNLANI